MAEHKFHEVNVPGVWQSAPQKFRFQVDGVEVDATAFNQRLQEDAEKLEKLRAQVRDLREALVRPHRMRAAEAVVVVARLLPHCPSQAAQVSVSWPELAALHAAIGIYDASVAGDAQPCPQGESVPKQQGMVKPSYVFEHMNLSDVPDATKIGMRVGGVADLGIDFTVDRAGKITATGVEVMCSNCGTVGSLDCEDVCRVCGLTDGEDHPEARAHDGANDDD